MDHNNGSSGQARPRSKNRGGRPRKDPLVKLGLQLALRLDPQLLARLDAHLARLKAREPAANWTRGSAIRELMTSALLLAENPPQK